MTKTIVVLGATGKQGGSVANTFLNEPGWKVRGITRDPCKASSKALADKGVEVVGGDVDDSLTTGVKPGQTIAHWAYDLEVIRGKNIVDAAATIVGRPLEKFIWSALSNAKERSKRKYTHVYHFDAKAAITQYIYDAQPRLAKVTSIMQVGTYTSNCFSMPHFAPRKQSDGVYELALPVLGSAKFPFIVVENDTGAFAKVLNSLPAGQRILAHQDAES